MKAMIGVACLASGSSLQSDWVFFTGGIQHFPDSPQRSVWVVPLGFALSVVALYMLEGREKMSARAFALYAALGTALVVAGCFGAWEIVDQWGGTPHTHTH